MKIQNIKKQLAFTLVELIIVIAIISLLAAIVVVTLNPFSIFQSGRNSQRANDLSTIQNAITRYLSETPITGAAHYLSDLHGYNDLLNAAAEGNFICPNGSNLDTLTNYYSLDTSGTNIIDLSNLLNGGYLPRVPKDPSTNSSYRACVDTVNNSKVVLFGAKTESSSSTVAVALNTPTPNSGISNGLVGYWKMDEASGTSVADSSGNTNTGTASGTTVVSGKYNNGRSFNGTTDGISVPNSTSLNPPQYVTLSTWVKPSTQLQNWGMFTTKGNAFQLRFWNTSYRPELYLTTSVTAIEVIASTSLTVGTWNSVIAVYDGTKAMIYINGVLENTVNITGTISNTAVPLYIGQRSDGYYYTGTLDESRIYNRALSSTEVSALYNWGPSPIAYYRFDEGSGNTAYDGSVNALNGTWNGTGTPRYTSGKYGSAGNFNGSTDYISNSSTGILNIVGNSMTVSAWVYINSYAIGGYAGIVGKGGVNLNAGYELLYNATGILYFAINGNFTQSAAPVALNSWHYITGRYDGSNLDLYIDGILSNTSAKTGNVIDSSAYSFEIGRRNLGNANPLYVNGRLDEIKVYNYARTPAQIQADMS